MDAQLINPNTSQKSYWKIIKRVMNKCNAQKIPLILRNSRFIINYKAKADKFIAYFSQQCKPLVNDSVLLYFSYLTDKRLVSIRFTSDDIIAQIRSLNLAKSNGPDGISSELLLLADDSIVSPLMLIFTNILTTGIYPELWKLANITPIHKKGSKQLIENYRLISLLPICGNVLENIFFKQLYNYMVSNNLITNNQSGFYPQDSTVNQLIHLINDIHKSFDNRKSFETHAVFLDISKGFDKVWQKGLIFNLEQNGISGPVLN